MAEKRLFGKKIIDKEIFFGKFLVGGEREKYALTASSSINCDCADGTIARGVGMESYTVNDAAVTLSPTLQARFFITLEKDDGGEKKETIGYITHKNAAYVYDETQGTFYNIGTLQGGGVMTPAIDKNGDFKTLFACKTGAYRLEQKRLLQCTDAACQTAICFYGGRVFIATRDFWVLYSAPYAPTDFTENADDSGMIALRNDCGKIVGLLGLKNRLCVLYEYGISMITLDGSARSFERKDVVYNGGKIFGETACVANVGGEKAYFLAEDGVYRFDGVKLEKTCKNVTISATKNYSCGRAIAEGKYFVTYTDKDGVWRTLAVDLETGKGDETFVMNGLYSWNGKTLFGKDGVLYKIVKYGDLPTGEKAEFTVEKTDFSVRGSKTLKALRFCGEGSFDLTVTGGKKTKRISVLFEGGLARVPLAIRATDFTIAIEPHAGVKIRNMTAELQTLE